MAFAVIAKETRSYSVFMPQVNLWTCFLITADICSIYMVLSQTRSGLYPRELEPDCNGITYLAEAKNSANSSLVHQPKSPGILLSSKTITSVTNLLTLGNDSSSAIIRGINDHWLSFS